MSQTLSMPKTHQFLDLSEWPSGPRYCVGKQLPEIHKVKMCTLTTLVKQAISVCKIPERET